MHVTDKVNEELERLFSRSRSTIRHGRRQRTAGKVGQDGADVVYGVEDVGELGAGPAVRAGELAVVRRVVAHAFGVVKRGGPVRAEADLVGPGGDRREVTRRVDVGVGVDITFGTEDGADGAQGSWVEVRLCEGGDDFVAFFEGRLEREGDKRGVGVGRRGRHVPAAPQAITLGRLLRPTRAAATNVRMTGIRYCKRNRSRVIPLICKVTGTAKHGEMQWVCFNCIVMITRPTALGIHFVCTSFSETDP